MNYVNSDNIVDHPFYLLGEDVNDICEPLFKNFPINYFCYGRRYYDNTVLVLTSNKDWMRHYMTAQDYPFMTNGKKIHSRGSTMVPTALEDAESIFGLYNGVLIEKVHSDYVESLDFASTNLVNNPLEFCYDKDLLNNFFFILKKKFLILLRYWRKIVSIFPKVGF